MGNSKQYTDAFRSEAVEQTIKRPDVVDVAGLIGIPERTLYGWVHKSHKAATSDIAHPRSRAE